MEERKRDLRIGVSALHRASGGSLTHLVHLLAGWKRDGTLARHRFVIFVGPDSQSALRQALPDVMDLVDIAPFPSAGRGLLQRLFDEQIRLPRALLKHSIDVLLCPANVMPYATRVPVVASFQNAAPFCETVTPASVGLRPWLQFALLGWFMRATARRATIVIFISRFFRDLFVERFGFDAKRGRVIPRAAEDSAAAADPELEARLGVRRPFLLSVSHLNPYKNTIELIEGFALASKDLPPRQLVLAGMANFAPYAESIRATIARLGLAERVLLTGELPHADALSLVAGCEAFVFTSTCENCPTALVEAMSTGAPVASSNVGVMPEVTGDAALLFDPAQPAEIAEALRRMMTDPQLCEELRRRSLARAQTFITRDTVARQTIEAIEMASGKVNR